MPEKTKPKTEITPLNEIEPAKADQNETNESWSADQQKHSYYYDDSYGYEVYDPERDDDETDC